MFRHVPSLKVGSSPRTPSPSIRFDGVNYTIYAAQSWLSAEPVKHKI